MKIWPWHAVDMQIDERQLQLFIQLYQEEFGVILSEQEAFEKASLVMQYVLMCMKPFSDSPQDDIINMPD